MACQPLAVRCGSSADGERHVMLSTSARCRAPALLQCKFIIAFWPRQHPGPSSLLLGTQQSVAGVRQSVWRPQGRVGAQAGSEAQGARRTGRADAPTPDGALRPRPPAAGSFPVEPPLVAMPYLPPARATATRASGRAGGLGGAGGPSHRAC